MTESLEREKYIESFLSNQAFLRFARSFEVYQELLNEDGADIEILTESMHYVFPVHLLEPEDMETKKILDAYNEIKIYCLQSSEKGEFDKRKLAEIIVGLPIRDKLFELWNPRQIHRRVGTEHQMINDILSYSLDTVNGKNTLSLHIELTSISGKELWPEIVRGLIAVAEKLENDGMDEVEQVYMASWLFNESFETRVQALFGNEAKIEYLSEDDENENVSEIIKLALTYNERSLREFLKDGIEPQVGRLILTKAEFVANTQKWKDLLN